MVTDNGAIFTYGLMVTER